MRRLQLVRVEDDVAHAEAEGAADVVWFPCPCKIFDDEEQVGAHLQDLLLALLGVARGRLARVLLADCYEVDFEFVF